MQRSRSSDSTKKKSAKRGNGTSVQVEVANVSPHGFWLLIGDREHFLSFKEFPWFREATIAQISNVELPSPHHLCWPSLDVDLALESLTHPDRYPLISNLEHRIIKISKS
jgi:hypothetical protein